MSKRKQTTNLRDNLDPMSKKQRLQREQFMRSMEEFDEWWDEYSEFRSKHNKYLAKTSWMAARGWQKND